MVERREKPLPLTYRQANTTDALLMAQLRERAYFPGQTSDSNRIADFEGQIFISLKFQDRAAEPKTPRSFIAYEGDNPVGYVLMSKPQKAVNEMFIASMVTVPEARTAGLIMSMTKHLLEMRQSEEPMSFAGFARESTTATILQRPAVQQFLARQGYEAVLDTEVKPQISDGERHPYVVIRPLKAA